MVIRSKICLSSCQRPYHVEHTSSRPITEVKQHWAWIVLGWETAWELQVLLASFYVNLSLSYMEEVSKKVIVIFGHRLMICSKIAPLLWGHTHLANSNIPAPKANSNIPAIPAPKANSYIPAIPAPEANKFYLVSPKISVAEANKFYLVSPKISVAEANKL